MSGPVPAETRLPVRAPAPEELVGLLADPVRRRLLAAVILGRITREELLAAADCETRAAVEALHRLEHAQVLVADAGRYSLADDVFGRSARDAASERMGPLNDRHTQLARRYFFRNRLLQMPSDPWAVSVVLDLVAEDFQPGEVYSEREVNTTLYGWYGDWALLRRLLVDHGYLQRDHGSYWRETRDTP